MAGIDFTGQKISETYQRVVQYDSGSNLLYDGLGNLVTVSASAESSSHANFADSASYAVSAGDYEQRLTFIQSVTGSYATTGSNVFSANQTITGSIYVSQSVETWTLDFTDLNIPPYKAGRMYYNTEDDAVSVYGDVSGVSLQIGQETWVKVVNKTSAQINNGQAVYIDGAQGNRPTVRPTTTLNHSGSQLIGLATHNIAINQEGYVTVRGLVRDLDTLKYTEGDSLYLSGSNGGYTSSMLPSPAHSNQVGYVVVAHGTQGIVLVAPAIGGELAELHDVCSQITSKDGNLLFYNMTSGLWSGSYARNFILDSNNRVGISTTSPSYSLDVHGDARITGSLYVTGSVFLNASVIKANKTITSNYDVSTSDSVVLANTITTFSASLYDATGQDGNSLYFKVIGNFPLTITPYSGQTIDGNSNLIITDKWTSVEMITSGSNWYII